MIGTFGKEIEDLISKKCTGNYLTVTLEMDKFIEMSDEELDELVIEDLEPLNITFVREMIEATINISLEVYRRGFNTGWELNGI